MTQIRGIYNLVFDCSVLHYKCMLQFQLKGNWVEISNPGDNKNLYLCEVLVYRSKPGDEGNLGRSNDKSYFTVCLIS